MTIYAVLAWLTRLCYYPPSDIEEYRETASFAEFRLHLDAAAETAHYELAYTESKACALLELIFLEETAEHHFPVLFRETDARVLNIQFNLVCILIHLPSHCDASLGSELRGICDKVCNNLTHTSLVHIHCHVIIACIAELQMARYLHEESLVNLVHHLLH